MGSSELLVAILYTMVASSLSGAEWAGFRLDEMAVSLQP